MAKVAAGPYIGIVRSICLCHIKRIGRPNYYLMTNLIIIRVTVSVYMYYIDM